MKISVDGGGLGAKIEERSGNYVFSENLIKALSLYDRKNQYYIYTFDKLKPKFFWSKVRLSIEELVRKKDVFLGLNQAIPLYVSGKTISFCHGLSYYFYPQHYSKNDYRRLKSQLNEMIERSDKIIVSSQKVKNELASINQIIEAKIIVLLFGIPFDMTKENVKKKAKYFLFVANNQPIKNINFILQSFNRLKQDIKYEGYKLFLVGDWKEYKNKNQGMISIGNVSRQKLKKLYQKATALLTSSYYESFNLPVLEALSQDCPVIGLKSAIIPELEPYVNIAGNKEEMIKLMTDSSKDKLKKIDRRKIINRFCWKNYIKNLIKEY